MSTSARSLGHLSERQLLKRLRAQGFTTERTKAGWLVTNTDTGKQHSFHPSSLDRTSNIYRNIIKDLEAIGFDPTVVEMPKPRVKTPLLAPMPMVDEDHGTRYRLLFVSDLKVDAEYQRAVRPRHVESIAANFNIVALGALVVSEREDGYFVIDGQHRLEVLKRRGWGTDGKKVAALVVTGLSPEDEAGLFVNLNYRKGLRPYDLFKARVAQGDPVAQDVIDTMAMFDLEVVDTRGKFGTDGRKSSACTTLYELATRKVLYPVLEAIQDGWGFEDPYALSSAVLKGVGAMFTAPSWAGLLDKAHLVKVMGKTNPTEIMRVATQRASATIAGAGRVDRPKAVLGILYDLYNFGLSEQRRLPSGPELPGGKYR